MWNIQLYTYTIFLAENDFLKISILDFSSYKKMDLYLFEKFLKKNKESLPPPPILLKAVAFLRSVLAQHMQFAKVTM